MASKTTHARVYRDDLKEITFRFPNIKFADFVHMSVKTNPFIQAEAMLRGSKRNEQKR